MAETELWDDGVGRHVALLKRFAVDQITPISAYIRLRPWGAHTLLESVEGDEKVSRYSFIALGAWCRLTEREGRAVLQTTEGERDMGDDPLVVLRSMEEALRVGVPDSEPLPFPGGAVGYFGYDWVRALERLPNRHGRRGPTWEWVWPQSVVAFDHRRQSLTVIVESERESLGAARDRLDRLVDALCAPAVSTGPTVTLEPGSIRSNLAPAAYHASVMRAQDYIRAGDIFQVVLSQRLEAAIDGDALGLYRRLRRLNPSPYLFFLETPARTMVGSSPEALVTVQEGRVVSRPIAGTRPRGKTAAEDEAMWDDLIQDDKERAEHMMLVDLARNDLGRVSVYGSVQVDRLMVRESFSHVMHIVSEVSGRLAPGYDALDALRATFPAGTLTGAPKIRAMEIIDELEPDGRGAYGGVVGYFSHRGDLDTCITIRTIDIVQGTAMVQAGAGIVADSVAEREYEESLNKARAGLTVLEAGDQEWV